MVLKLRCCSSTSPTIIFLPFISWRLNWWVPGQQPSPGETSEDYYFLVFTSWSHGSMSAITLLSEWQRNMWPIRNAGEPGTSFILSLRNVCWVNFLHQSWVMGVGGGDFPLVSGVCLHMQLPAIADEPSQIRGTSSLWEYPVVGCAFMQRRIVFPLFMLPLWAYILFMNSWEPASHIWLYVCICISAGNFLICQPQWLDSEKHPMFEPFDLPIMIDELEYSSRDPSGWWIRQTSYG